MPRSIANYNGAGAAINRSSIESLQRLGVAAGSVLGDVDHLKPEGDPVLNSLVGGLQEKIFGPALGMTTNRAGSDKGGGCDFEAGFLHDFRDRTNVILVSAGGTVGLDLHFLADDFLRQRAHMLHGAEACSRQSQVECVDAERLHQV